MAVSEWRRLGASANLVRIRLLVRRVNGVMELSAMVRVDIMDWVALVEGILMENARMLC